MSGSGGNKGEWDLDDADKRPPDNPPNVIYHTPIEQLSEGARRVFGTPPPKDAKRPVPPPPLPPNSYHKKPKYWQMRNTSHGQIPNRIAGVMCIAICGATYLLHKYSNAPQRWSKRLGLGMTPEEKEDYDKQNEMFFEMLLSANPDHYATTHHGEYINVHKADKNVRWDLREVDRNIVGTRDMANPMDNPL